MEKHLKDVEYLLNNGQYLEAKKVLGEVNLNSKENKDEKFLMGLISKYNGDKTLATKYFLKNCSSEIENRSANEAIKLLYELGFKRELKNFIEILEDDKNIGEETNQLMFKIKKQIAKDVVISIHQPSYLGWLGYFHKIFYADKFIIHDAVKFSKNSFIKRVLIRKSTLDESIYLSIPAKKCSDFTLIKDIQIQEDLDWRKDHLNKIYAAYCKSPKFNEIYPRIEKIFNDSRNLNNLVELTKFFTKGILEILEIRKELYLSSDLLDNFKGVSAHDKNMYLCKFLNGSIYLSGTGAKDYQDKVEKSYPIKMIYQNIYNYFEDNQYSSERKFINGLSIIDALFYVGPQKILDFFNKYSDPSDGLYFLG